MVLAISNFDSNHCQAAEALVLANEELGCNSHIVPPSGGNFSGDVLVRRPASASSASAGRHRDSAWSTTWSERQWSTRSSLGHLNSTPTNQNTTSAERNLTGSAARRSQAVQGRKLTKPEVTRKYSGVYQLAHTQAVLSE